MRQPVVAGVEPVAGRLAVLPAAVASLVDPARQQSVRSAGHPYFAAPLILYPRDDPLHRLFQLLERQMSTTIASLPRTTRISPRLHT